MLPARGSRCIGSPRSRSHSSRCAAGPRGRRADDRAPLRSEVEAVQGAQPVRWQEVAVGTRADGHRRTPRAIGLQGERVRPVGRRLRSRGGTRIHRRRRRHAVLTPGPGRETYFCVITLIRDGLRVPPFDRHPDGDGALRTLGLDATAWLAWVREVVVARRQLQGLFRSPPPVWFAWGNAPQTPYDGRAALHFPGSERLLTCGRFGRSVDAWPMVGTSSGALPTLSLHGSRLSLERDVSAARQLVLVPRPMAAQPGRTATGIWGRLASEKSSTPTT